MTIARSLLVVCAAATLAAAVDVPVSGTSLTLRRSGSGAEKLVFVSSDPALPFPAIGGPDDPTAGSPGGALIEVISTNDSSVGAFTLPSTLGNPGWSVKPAAVGQYNFRNADAPGAPSVVKALVLKQGRRFKVTASRVGIDLDGPQGGVAIRVTMGGTRFCARFDGASVVQDEADRFRGRQAPATALPDCSDATLGTAPVMHPGFVPGPWCAGDDVPLPGPADPSKTLWRVTLRDPLAVCNDGTPAVAYIRRAPAGSGHERDWLIWLEGGGSCLNPGDCADRWCGHQADYRATVMSSRWEPASKNAGGIFNRNRLANRFRDFNVVQAVYCSSDEWGGSHTVDVAATTSEATPAVSIPPYRIAFHGHHIVTALVAALREGVVADADPGVRLDPLTGAQRVIFAGSSAGAGGAISNGARVAEMIRAGGLPIDVQFVADAKVRPYEPDPPVVTEAQVAARRAVGAATAAWRGDVSDAGCVAAHPSEPEICREQTHVLFHHGTLRSFAQIDLRDPVSGPWAYPDMAGFRVATRALYQGFPALPPYDGEPVAVPTLAYFNPDCVHHVTLSEDDAYYDIRLPAGGTNLNEALWDWWANAQTPRLVDDGPAFPSQCP